MAKILIVDDEPRIRDLIREHLQYAGFVCEEAGDGGAALAVLAGTPVGSTIVVVQIAVFIIFYAAGALTGGIGK